MNNLTNTTRLIRMHMRSIINIHLNTVCASNINRDYCGLSCRLLLVIECIQRSEDIPSSEVDVGEAGRERQGTSQDSFLIEHAPKRSA